MNENTSPNTSQNTEQAAAASETAAPAMQQQAPAIEAPTIEAPAVDLSSDAAASTAPGALDAATPAIDLPASAMPLQDAAGAAVPTLDANAFGIAHLWGQSDFVIKFIFGVLFTMSAVSWAIIAVRGIRQLRIRGFQRAVDGFWHARDLQTGLNLLATRAPRSPFLALAQRSAYIVEHLHQPSGQKILGAPSAPDEFITRALRKSISFSSAQLEWGMTALASIGSTAPFVGLFGTVWGIYHAMITISASGQATIDKVAGPVGEALIMTALGLFVAIPAVLAYNTFTRSNRLELTELDAFAFDLHDWLNTGGRLGKDKSAPVSSYEEK